MSKYLIYNADNILIREVEINDPDSPVIVDKLPLGRYFICPKITACSCPCAFKRLSFELLSPDCSCMVYIPPDKTRGYLTVIAGERSNILNAVQDVKVEILTASDRLVTAGYTDTTGMYMSTALPLGEYRVRITPPPAFRDPGILNFEITECRPAATITLPLRPSYSDVAIKMLKNTD